MSTEGTGLKGCQGCSTLSSGAHSLYFIMFMITRGEPFPLHHVFLASSSYSYPRKVSPSHGSVVEYRMPVKNRIKCGFQHASWILKAVSPDLLKENFLASSSPGILQLHNVHGADKDDHIVMVDLREGQSRVQVFQASPCPLWHKIKEGTFC